MLSVHVCVKPYDTNFDAPDEHPGSLCLSNDFQAKNVEIDCKDPGKTENSRNKGMILHSANFTNVSFIALNAKMWEDLDFDIF
jgi:hypothetical protein